ncbi:MAG: hypothetical protein H7335_17370 [Massilia sp.]|nr:hypothetical protein [Massilia sp.]
MKKMASETAMASLVRDGSTEQITESVMEVFGKVGCVRVMQRSEAQSVTTGDDSKMLFL